MERIIEAIPLAHKHLLVKFTSGAEVEIDFGPIIGKGGVLSALADEGTFTSVQVAPNRRYVEWPGEVDFCAHALRRGLNDTQQAASDPLLQNIG